MQIHEIAKVVTDLTAALNAHTVAIHSLVEVQRSTLAAGISANVTADATEAKGTEGTTKRKKATKPTAVENPGAGAVDADPAAILAQQAQAAAAAQAQADAEAQAAAAAAAAAVVPPPAPTPIPPLTPAMAVFKAHAYGAAGPVTYEDIERRKTAESLMDGYAAICGESDASFTELMRFGSPVLSNPETSQSAMAKYSEWMQSLGLPQGSRLSTPEDNTKPSAVWAGLSPGARYELFNRFVGVAYSLNPNVTPQHLVAAPAPGL